jgi:hypothetical protein
MAIKPDQFTTIGKVLDKIDSADTDLFLYAQGSAPFKGTTKAMMSLVRGDLPDVNQAPVATSNGLKYVVSGADVLEVLAVFQREVEEHDDGVVDDDDRLAAFNHYATTGGHLSLRHDLDPSTYPMDV